MTGQIINTHRNYSNRYGSLMQISYFNAESFIGSPVIGSKGNVIGMHFINRGNESYALNINIIKNMIDQLVLVSSDPSKRLFRGDIGISLDLISYKTATSNYKLSQQILNDRHHPLSNNNKFLLINSIYPNSSAYGILKPGDIIYKVNNYIISDNLILFDEFINNSKEMFEIQVSRNGEIRKFNFNVKNVAYSMTKYLYIAGGYFLDIDDYIRSRLFTNQKGAYLTYVDDDKTFDYILKMNHINYHSSFIITAINSNAISSISEMFEFFKKNCKIENFYIEALVIGARVDSNYNYDSNYINLTSERNLVFSFNLPNTQKESMKLYSKSDTSHWSSQLEFNFQTECDRSLPDFDIDEIKIEKYENDDPKFENLEDSGISGMSVITRLPY